MLYIVLTLVLAAFGLLVVALTTANTLWAWISVVVSVVAAALLVTDWVNGRRRSRAGEPDRRTDATVGGSRHRRGGPDVEDLHDEGFRDGDLRDGEDELLADEDVFPREVAREPDRAFKPELAFEQDLEFEPVAETGQDAVRTVVTQAVEPPVDRAVEDRPQDNADSADYAAEPGEEPTDASDLLVVAGLNAEVRVVDEHPRYHLATCVWLANRPTIPVPISEARQLGFTPCARCGPDSVLAARHRAAR